jgi:hypothetical protein
MGLGLCKTENITQMITISVITLSSFHCTIVLTMIGVSNSNRTHYQEGV